MSRRTKIVVAILVALIGAGLTLTIEVVDNGPDHGDQPRRTTTIRLGGPGHKALPLPPAAKVIAKSQEAQDRAGAEEAAHADLKAELPSASAPATIEAERELAPPGQPRVPRRPPLAAPELAGCSSYPVRNYSLRGGAPILLGVTHWTASRDTSPSRAGVLGNVRWFDNPASQASSHEVIDRRGFCALTVGEAYKAWTQANYNRVSVAVEVTNNGSEVPLVLPGSGFNRLVDLYVGWHKRWKLPLQRARVYTGLGSACPTVYKPGILEHRDLGPCGGGHPDVGGSPIVDLAIKAARGRVYGSAKPRPPAGKAVVRACRHVERNRRIERAGSTTAAQRAHARRHLRDVRRRGFACGPKGPVRVR